MTNEAVILELFQGVNPIRLATGVGNTIAKGDLLILSGGDVVRSHTVGDGGLPFAGVAAAEHVAGQGEESIAAHRQGFFDLRVSGGTCEVGDTLVLADPDPNVVKQSTVNQISGGNIVGMAMEAASDPETVRVLLGVG